MDRARGLEAVIRRPPATIADLERILREFLERPGEWRSGEGWR